MSSQEPLLCLWPERALYIGRLSDVAPHRHVSSVCLLALDGVVRVRSPPDAVPQIARSALIPAGRSHPLVMRNSLVAVIYSDPHRPHYRRLTAHGQEGTAELDTREEHRMIAVLRSLHAAAPPRGDFRIGAI